MRTFIFTERDRRLLRRWLESGEEDGETQKLFTGIRQNVSQLAEDVDLMLRVIRELRRRHRWWGRITGRSEFGSALQRAESALARVGRGRRTSADQRR